MHELLARSAAEIARPADVLLRLVVAALLGGVVALVYRRTRFEPASSFTTTLVLLAILIAMVTQVVGDNVARAFSLVGALSIVRFRTVVRDTQDTAYVIFAVAIGMAIGAHNIRVASPASASSRWRRSRCAARPSPTNNCPTASRFASAWATIRRHGSGRRSTPSRAHAA